MQDEKREYTPPVLVPMGTIRTLTRTTEIIGSPATDDQAIVMADAGIITDPGGTV